MPATSRAMTQTLSATPIKKTNARIKLNQGIPAANSPAMQLNAGPAISAERVPRRSRTTPLTGKPANRPSANAVMICAAVPAEMPNDFANTGRAGTTIDHIPANRVLA